jgi:hypothetical protein
VAAVDAAVARLDDAGAPATVRVLLERVRGVALARVGRAAEARSSLDEALDVAERAQADYEIALTLRAIGRLDGEQSSRAQEIFTRLGVDEAKLP